MRNPGEGRKSGPSSRSVGTRALWWVPVVGAQRGPALWELCGVGGSMSWAKEHGLDLLRVWGGNVA